MQDSIWDKLVDKIWYLKNSISNILYYFKIIWQDRDWDFYYIYVLLYYKIKKIRKRFETVDIYVGQKKEAKNLLICELLLKRLIDDNYQELLSNQIEEKWGKIIFKYEEIDGSNEYSTFTRTNIKTEKDEKQEVKEFKRMMDKKEYSRQQDKKYLFKLLEKRIEYWWD